MYASNESGNSQVYVQRFLPGETAGGRAGGKWQISTAGGLQPRWRRDGKELFYLALDRKIIAVPVQTGGTFQHGVPRALFQMRTAPGNFDQPYHYVAITFLGDATPPPLTIVLNWAAGVKK